MNQAQEIVDLARSLVDIKFRHMGCDLGGMDCLGVLLWIVREAGHIVPHIGEYSRKPSGRRMVEGLRKYLDRIPFAETRPGDVLHLAYGNQPQHVVIITNLSPMTVVHADGSVGKVTEIPFAVSMLNRLRGSYRIPDAPKWLK